MDLTLVSIVVGLGLTELLLTFHQLVRARRRVAWDALPLAWALLTLIAVVNFWWGIRNELDGVSGWSTGTFMLSMISPVFLFLTCAAALPRPEPSATLDMKTAYAEERTAFLLFFLSYQAGNWILDLAVLREFPQPIVAIHRTMVCAAMIIALLGRSRRWDWAALVVVAAAYAVRLVTQFVK